MSRAKDSEYWEHSSGYRLNADGKQIKYVNDEAGLVLVVEAEVNENQQELEYRVWLQDAENENVVYPEPFPTKEQAFEKLDELMEEYDRTAL